MTSATSNSYDEVPYISESFQDTHPRRLQSIATLFGLMSPPIEQCRVLELGCAGGGNLIPMAYALPEARFVGIDLSARQIQDACADTAALGLKNIEFRHASITDLTPADGQFDYIICHGVFSWVPPEVQEKILDICRDNLSPNGVAFVSYNTYPGWHMRQWVRDVMNYHAARFGTPQERVQAARSILKLVSESPLMGNEPLKNLLKREMEHAQVRSDSYLLHEHLEEYNQPMYFHEFMTRAARRGLQYLGDARTNGTLFEESWKPGQELLRQVAGDPIQTEQYADFLRNQAFRRTLLCHTDAKLDRTGALSRVEQLWVASSLRPKRPVSGPPESLEFTHPTGSGLTSSDPLIKASLNSLSQVYPQSVPFKQVCESAQVVLKLPTDVFLSRRQQLARELLRCWMLSLIDLHVTPPQFATHLSDHPVVSPVARLQARRSSRVTNLRHEMVKLDDNQQKFIVHVDGTRTPAELAMKIAEQRVTDGISAAVPANVLQQASQNQVRGALNAIAKTALLVG